MSTLTEIQNFIRDAQHKIAQLGIIINEKQYQDEYIEEHKLQLELIAMVNCLYVSQYEIKDSFNHLDWTDLYITKAIHYYRHKADLETVAHTNFINYAPYVCDDNTSSSNGLGITLPAGEGFLYKNFSGNLILVNQKVYISNFNSVFP